ncbi:MAG: agmatine deiminase family protein [Cytophagaceae bacterium]|nr:agmatine deiminase family protein [Cytophagaceae bacterium]
MFPKEKNFYFPAEWHPHIATWLTYPVNIDTWEDRLPKVLPYYFEFIKTLAKSEKVRINLDKSRYMEGFISNLEKFKVPEESIEIYDHPSNDSWCRDHGPGFLINRQNTDRLIIDWEYNAWGGKYPPFNDDNAIPKKISKAINVDYVSPGIIMEGGSVEFNDAGTILTSKSCLLNKNRNPHLNQSQIEEYLINYYGADQILWIEDGIVGDDTDGHIDDTVRFVNTNTVITMVEPKTGDDNHHLLKENLELLKKMRLQNGEKLNIVEIEMPEPVYDSGLRLPASYANFYISNQNVIVPTFRSKNDDKALKIIESCFPDRKITGIDSTEIIWGLGSFHCLSQQEPKSNFI